MQTHYSLLWKSFQETANYRTSVEVMAGKGLKQPYIDNILQLAFNCGYSGRMKDSFKTLANDKRRKGKAS